MLNPIISQHNYCLTQYSGILATALFLCCVLVRLLPNAQLAVYISFFIFLTGSCVIRLCLRIMLLELFEFVTILIIFTLVLLFLCTILTLRNKSTLKERVNAARRDLKLSCYHNTSRYYSQSFIWSNGLVLRTF